MNTINVKPLRMEAVNELISEVVHSELRAVARLAELVHRKTHGNPFFTIAFLTKLYQTGMLVRAQSMSIHSFIEFTPSVSPVTQPNNNNNGGNSTSTTRNTNGDGSCLRLSQ